jgi:hypothetical protein
VATVDTQSTAIALGDLVTPASPDTALGVTAHVSGAVVSDARQAEPDVVPMQVDVAGAASDIKSVAAETTQGAPDVGSVVAAIGQPDTEADLQDEGGDEVEEDDEATPKTLNPAPQRANCEVWYDDELNAFRLGKDRITTPRRGLGISSDSYMAAVIANHRLAGGRLLVGFGVGFNSMGAKASPILWTFDCANPKAPPIEVLTRPGADFGHSVLERDGSSLLFSDRTGLARLRLSDLAVETLITRPAIPADCRDQNADPHAAEGQSIFPQALSEDGLVVYMGARCGFEGDFDTIPYVVADPAKTRVDDFMRRHPVAALARGTDGTLWLGDAGRCDGGVQDNASGDTVWRSTDDGRTWTPLTLGLDSGSGEHPVAEILVDAEDPNKIAVRTATCQGGGGEVAGGSIAITLDGGRKWRKADGKRAESGGGPVVFAQRLWSPSGKLDHLIAAVEGNEGLEIRESRDLGRTWKRASRKTVVPQASSPKVEVPGVSLVVSPLGLWRVEDAKRELVFPPAGLFIRRPQIFRRALGTNTASSKSARTWAELDAAMDANAKGLRLAREKKFPEAIGAYEEAYRKSPGDALSRYNAACAHALSGAKDKALALLEEVLALDSYRGRVVLSKAASDRDLASLKDDPRFARLRHVEVPEYAFENSDGSLYFGVASDRAERLCVFGAQDSGEGGGAGSKPGLRHDRADCTSGAFVAPFGNKDDAVAWVHDLGMVAWAPVKAGSLEYKTGRAWFADRIGRAAYTKASLEVYRSPSGRHIAAVANGADGKVLEAVGAWPETKAKTP